MRSAGRSSVRNRKVRLLSVNEQSYHHLDIDRGDTALHSEHHGPRRGSHLSSKHRFDQPID